MLIRARVVQGAGGAMASGLFNTTVQIGGAVGLAVLATLSSEETAGRLADGEGAASALTAGYQLAFTLATVLLVVAVAVAALVLEKVEPQEAVTGEPAYEMG